MSYFRMLLTASSEQWEGPFHTNQACSLELLVAMTSSLTLFDVPGMVPCA